MESTPRSVSIVSVNVGEPEIIGTRRGEPVLSSIYKRPVVGRDTLTLSNENLPGNLQADLRAHGGPDKAVYVYPSEHLPLWNADYAPDQQYGPGAFGENLTVAGWLESDARIGDVWSWGDALLQICQPRYPCFKLAMKIGRNDVLKRMLETRRNGWYLRVLQPGEVPVAGPISVIDRGAEDATVLDAVLAVLPGAPGDLVERIAAVGPLAERWRGMVIEKS